MLEYKLAPAATERPGMLSWARLAASKALLFLFVAFLAPSWELRAQDSQDVVIIPLAPISSIQAKARETQRARDSRDSKEAGEPMAAERAEPIAWEKTDASLARSPAPPALPADPGESEILVIPLTKLPSPEETGPKAAGPKGPGPEGQPLEAALDDKDDGHGQERPESLGFQAGPGEGDSPETAGLGALDRLAGPESPEGYPNGPSPRQVPRWVDSALKAPSIGPARKSAPPEPYEGFPDIEVIPAEPGSSDNLSLGPLDPDGRALGPVPGIEPEILLASVSAPREGKAHSPAEGRARMLFVGDIMVHGQQLAIARKGKEYDFSYQFPKIAGLLADSYLVGNLETVLAGEGSSYAGYPAFNTPDSFLLALKSLGLDAVTLANNHIMDRKAEGAKRTVGLLEGAGIKWTGLGLGEIPPNAPLLVEHGGLRWAFLSFAYGSNTVLPQKDPSSGLHLNVMNEEDVLSGIKAAKALSPDVLAVFFHWGNEYQLSPTKGQKDMAALCLQNGAQLVIGTHPHVLQPMEIAQTPEGPALVAYSLGNFVSNQRSLPRERSVVLAVEMERNPDGRARLAKVEVAPIWTLARGGKNRTVEVVYAGDQSYLGEGGLRPAWVAGEGTDKASPAIQPAGLFDLSPPLEQREEPVQLTGPELSKMAKVGQAVVDFLGASPEPGPDGFHSLWDTSSPETLPVPRRKSPS
jgi:poly-gamma-glutamate synthesis protein (capsule biosynthesis protein)